VHQLHHLERSAPCLAGVVSNDHYPWRLASLARDVREKASLLPHGRERDDMLKKASQAEPRRIWTIGSTHRIAVAEVSIETGYFMTPGRVGW
jgi:hypothetical protein